MLSPQQFQPEEASRFCLSSLTSSGAEWEASHLCLFPRLHNVEINGTVYTDSIDRICSHIKRKGEKGEKVKRCREAPAFLPQWSSRIF